MFLFCFCLSWILYKKRERKNFIGLVSKCSCLFIEHWDFLRMPNLEIHSVVYVFPMHLKLNNHEAIHSCAVMVVCLFASYDWPKTKNRSLKSERLYIFILLLLLVRFPSQLYSQVHHRHHHYHLVDKIQVDLMRNFYTKIIMKCYLFLEKNFFIYIRILSCFGFNFIPCRISIA